MRTPTIAHGVAPKAARTPSIAQSMAQPVVDEEAGEKPVAAEPRMDRSAFLYRERREGIEGPSYAGQCGSCMHFISEALMRGAVSGNRCELFGSNFPVADDDKCHLQVPWPDGKPCDRCLAHAAEEMVEGCRGSIDPWLAGYRMNIKPRCEYCRFYDVAEKECEMLEELNAKVPLVFDLNIKVKPDAKCNLFTSPPPPEMDNG